MTEYILTKKSNLIAVADSVRGRTGETDKITLGEMIDDISYVIGGVELPELTFPAVTDEVFSGKEYIDGSGNIVTGTFSIDEELSAQDDLIAQIQSAVDNLPEAGGGSSGSVETCTVEVSNTSTFPCIYTTVKNGSVITEWTTNGSNLSHSLTAVCGSYLFVQMRAFLPAYEINGNARHIENWPLYNMAHVMVFQITASAGETVTINCYDDD